MKEKLITMYCCEVEGCNFKSESESVCRKHEEAHKESFNKIIKAERKNRFTFGFNNKNKR